MDDFRKINNFPGINNRSGWNFSLNCQISLVEISDICVLHRVCEKTGKYIFNHCAFFI